MAIAFRSAAGYFAPDVSTASVTVTKPTGLAVGDFMLLSVAITQDDTAALTVGCTNSGGTGGWTSLLPFTAVSGTLPRRAMMWKIAVASDVAATSFTVTKTAASANRAFNAIISAWTGVDAASPILAGPTAGGTAAVGATAVSVTPPATSIPAGRDGIMMITFPSGASSGTAGSPGTPTWGIPTSMSAARQQTTEWMISGHFYQWFTTNVPATAKTSTLSGGATLATQGMAYSILLRPAVTAVAPTVGAGADASVTQHQTFSRTATENDGGAAISSRAWTVLSGPAYVGTTIGTAAALNWIPRTAGNYVLRYTATNSQGSGSDDVALTVSTYVAWVTGSLVLGASRTGSKQVQGSRSAPMVLSASRTGTKRVAVARSAAIRIFASMVGQRINLVSANIRLSAALVSAGSSQGGYVTANMRISAATSARVHRGYAARTAPLVLSATRTGTKRVSAARTAPIRIFAARTGTKRVAGTRQAPIRLFAAVPTWLHAGKANRTAAIRIFGASSQGRHVTAPVARNALIRLFAARTTSSVRTVPQNVYAPIRIFAIAVTERVVLEARVLRPRADTLVKYDLVVVARVPQVSGPPMFIEVDPLDWTGITHTEALNEAPKLSINCKMDTVSESIMQRLRTPHELPSELWLYRNGRVVFSGPLLGGRAGDDSLSLEAQGALAYTGMWHVTADRLVQSEEQMATAKWLIDQWQTLEYGHFGLDTTGVGVSGIARTVEMKRNELNNVLDRILDFTKLSDGFDIWVDPANRLVNMSYPIRGVDRSKGEDAIIFDARNVTNSDVMFSLAPGDLASDGFGTGTQSGSDIPLVSSFANTELRSKYGRTSVTGNFQAADQGSLDSAVISMVDARDQVLLIPGPDARVTLDADLAAYDVGDTIAYQAHSRLSASGSYRIRKRVVKVNDTNTETVSVEFV